MDLGNTLLKMVFFFSRVGKDLFFFFFFREKKSMDVESTSRTFFFKKKVFSSYAINKLIKSKKVRDEKWKKKVLFFF